MGGHYPKKWCGCSYRGVKSGPLHRQVLEKILTPSQTVILHDIPRFRNLKLKIWHIPIKIELAQVKEIKTTRNTNENISCVRYRLDSD